MSLGGQPFEYSIREIPGIRDNAREGTPLSVGASAPQELFLKFKNMTSGAFRLWSLGIY